MLLDNAIEIKKPDPDSHFRLRPCKCSSDNVAYVLMNDGQWHAECFDCGRMGPAHSDRHEAQVTWNRAVRV